MPPPESLQSLMPILLALGLLLTAGMASLLFYILRPQKALPPWRVQLAESAKASPWQWRDLLNLLFLVVIAQIGCIGMPPSLLLSVLTFPGVILIGIAWLARHKSRPFGIPIPGRALMGEVLLRWLAILPLLWFFAFLWQLLLKGFGIAPDLQENIHLFIDNDSLLQRGFFIFLAVVVAPLAEEGLFRGILQPLLIRRFGAVAGLALTALGFAALHANLGAFVSLAVFSVALSLAAARTGTLWVPVLMHSLFNAISLVLLLGLIRAGVM